MAKFEEEENFITSKEQEKKIQGKKKINQKKTLDKNKIIVYSVFGLITLSIIIYLASTLSTETDKQVTEITTPESETDKYNSKIQAIEGEEKGNYQQKVDLNETFKNDKEKKEQERKQEEQLQAQIDKMNKQEEVTPVNQSSYKNTSSSYSSRNYNNNYKPVNSTKNRRVVYEENNQSEQVVSNPTPVKKQVEIKEKYSDNETNYGSGFFYKKKKNASSNSENDLMIYASIHTDQTIIEGSRVKMRLTKATTIDGNNYPINTIIYGTSSIKPNRLLVSINKINQTDVSLQIFDAEDSNEGIYIETPNLNAVIRKELKQDVANEKDLEKIPFSKTLRNLFQKKAKEEKLELLNNYKIIIKYKKKND